MSLRSSLTLRFAGVPALVLLLLTGGLYLGTTWLVAKQLKEEALVRVEQRGVVLTDRIGSSLSGYIRAIDRLARVEALNIESGHARSKMELDTLQQEMPGFTWIGVATPTGVVTKGTHGWLEGQNIADRPVFQNALNGLRVASFHPAIALDPYLKAEGLPAAQTADIGAVIRSETGSLLGVVTGHLDEQGFASLAQHTVTDREATELGLDWYVLAGPDHVISRRPLPFIVPARASSTPTEVLGRDGRWYLVAVNRVGEPGSLVRRFGWQVVVASDLDTALQPLRQFDRTLGWFAFVGAALLSLGGFLLAKRTTRPLDRFFSVIQHRFDAAGGDTKMGYSQYLDFLGTELASPDVELGTGQEILRRLAHDASQLMRVIDHFPMALSISSPDFRVEYVNQAYTRLLGYTLADIRDQRTAQYLLSPPEQAQHVEWLDQLKRDPAELVLRFNAASKDGRQIPIQGQMVPLFASDGKFSGVLSVVQDRSNEAMQSQRADAMSARLQLFADTALDYAFIGFDATGRVASWSRGAEALTGQNVVNAYGLPFEDLFATGERLMGVPARLLSEVRSNGAVPVECAFVCCDGTQFIGQGRLYHLKNSVDELSFALVLRDKTQEYEAEHRIQENERLLAQLTHRLLEQEKQTTRELAQALHDDLGQTLGAMRLLYDAGTADPNAVPNNDWVQRMGRLITDSNAQVRRVLTDLRPPLLDEQGLLSALENELRQRQSLAPSVKLELRMTSVRKSQRWDGSVEYAVFMVAREAVNNALKHASPSHVVVAIEGDELSLMLQVTDDGTGVDAPALPVKPGHLGLVGMRERATAIGAALTLQSSAQSGTSVLLTWEAIDEPTLLD